MNAQNLLQHPDGTYEASSIECAPFEGDTCKQFLEDISTGNARRIGELKCFDEKGEYKIIRDLKSSIKK